MPIKVSDTERLAAQSIRDVGIDVLNRLRQIDAIMEQLQKHEVILGDAIADWLGDALRDWGGSGLSEAEFNSHADHIKFLYDEFLQERLT